LIAQTPRITDNVVPGAEWQQASPESVGYSSAMLEALLGWVKTQDTTSMMVVVQGRVIFSYGDVSHTSKVASVRKSVLGMLYGKYVFDNTIDIDKTVKQLGLDDKQPFLPMEEKATLVQLLAARSGIYLPQREHPESLSAWDQGRYMPPRGSAYPGSQFVYNNWDFNAAGTAFEKLTHKGIYEALQTDLAVPIGMQDYAVAKQKKNDSPDSVHPEYAMYLSTRDMARLGLLMLDSGVWNGKTIVPGDWVRYRRLSRRLFTISTPWAFVTTASPPAGAMACSGGCGMPLCFPATPTSVSCRVRIAPWAPVANTSPLYPPMIWSSSTRSISTRTRGRQFPHRATSPCSQ
jgi:CubicO group peptidase (beta-lactamase class C family)